jgi:protein SCO1
MLARRTLIAALVALVAAGALTLSARLGPPPELHGTLLDPPLPAKAFALTSAGGARIGPETFRGKVTVLFFGFTHCPDVCPLTLQRLASAMAELGDRAGEVQVVLVSVDPERDPPGVVDAYARRFHPSFRGVTGTEEEVRAVAGAYGIFFARSPGSEAAGYSVDHSASTLVLDRDGGLRLIWPFDVGSDALAADLRYLLR